MTTADIMLASASPSSGGFAQPGDVESFRDHDDARTVFWALLAAIVIHFIMAFLLAAFGGVFSPSLPMQEKPVELTLVDLSPTSSKNSAFIETDESKKAPEPKDKTFESNANSIGASELAAAGELPLPSQAGKDRPLMDFETNPYSLETKGAQPQQSKPASQQKQMPAPQEAPITAAEQFALLTQKPAAAAERSTSASQPQSAYRRMKERNRISGNITSRGISAVNALGTPLGRYQKIVADSIGSRWYVFVDQQRDLITIGTLRLRFDIDRSGKVKNLKITENSSNEAFANVCVQSVLEAHLPPIPQDVANTLPPEGLEVDGLGFIIFPNR
jgi:outer membrane biosynthesis protein TonB